MSVFLELLICGCSVLSQVSSWASVVLYPRQTVIHVHLDITVQTGVRAQRSSSVLRAASVRQDLQQDINPVGGNTDEAEIHIVLWASAKLGYRMYREAFINRGRHRLLPPPIYLSD